MDKHSQHLDYVKSELIEGLGPLVKPDAFDIKVTSKQMTVATKTCEINPRLSLEHGERVPVKRDLYPDTPERELAEKMAQNLLSVEAEALTPYFDEIESVINTTPHKILSISAADASKIPMTLQPKVHVCGIEQCDQCLESGKVGCQSCSSKGRVKCGKCSGHGQYEQRYYEWVNITCNGCGGTGRVPVYGGPVACTMCVGGRRNVQQPRSRMVACGGCEQTGLVVCGTCKASGIVDCGHCKTQGSFLTEFKGVARYDVKEVTTYTHETLDGSPAHDLKPGEAVAPDSVTYEKVTIEGKRGVAATETKRYLATEVTITHPDLKGAKFILSGTEEVSKARTQPNHLGGVTTIHGREDVPGIVSQTNGFADGLISELLNEKNLKSVQKKGKAIDIITNVPAFESGSRLKLFSSNVKEQVKTLKSSYTADVLKKAESKRFNAMVLIWPLTLLALWVITYFMNIPIALIFGEGVFDTMTNWEYGNITLFGIGVIAGAYGIFSYPLVEKGRLPSEGQVSSAKQPWKRFWYFVFISASLFAVMVLIVLFGIGGKEEEEWAARLMALLAVAWLLPSFFIARANSCGSAKNYIKRMTEGRT